MFLQPERVPVKVYLSTDKDAPRLDRTAGSLLTILKACLVTGYGDKEGAGWTMPFEDTTRGLKVFRPCINPTPNLDYLLECCWAIQAKRTRVRP